MATVYGFLSALWAQRRPSRYFLVDFLQTGVMSLSPVTDRGMSGSKRLNDSAEDHQGNHSPGSENQVGRTQVLCAIMGHK